MTTTQLGPPDAGELSEATGAAKDSVVVAGWTVVSRVTGVVRVAAIGAVLGPTFFSNAFQFANTLPNLIFYTFLAGSLFSSLLVPALVGRIDAADRAGIRQLAGGFLGVSLLALGLIVPLAIAGGPVVLRLAAGGHPGATPNSQVVWLMILLLPQVFLYAVVGTASSVMNAHRRFALAAAAPAFENCGILLVLVATAVFYGTGVRPEGVPPGELFLLGLGSTGAVVCHAAAQWWGARRVGVLLVPRAGWRDREVLVLVRRALPSLGQAGLFGLQVLTMLVVVSRVPGGVVAFQVAMNFYALPLAVGATPVALALLPRLARLHRQGEYVAFRDTLLRGIALALFLTVPAALGYIALAHPLASTVAVGRMGTTQSVDMVAAAIAAMAPAVVAQTIFLICTYESYARQDTRTPMRAMLLQAAVCLGVAPVALMLHGAAVPLCLGLGYSLAVLISATMLAVKLGRRLGDGEQRLRPAVMRIGAAGLLMIVPVSLTASVVAHAVPGRPGSTLALVLGTAVGCAVFVGLQLFWRAPELAWVTGNFGRRRPLDAVCPR
ncbi:MAG: putative peptidoglycan lipid flippase [Frankiaceae bacterium]|jgi:putative peptidoglycan lipid II flippase|nr:putative peptidoglycan lipid flippase [Frankiaceae bacterium]